MLNTYTELNPKGRLLTAMDKMQGDAEKNDLTGEKLALLLDEIDKNHVSSIQVISIN